MLKKVLFLLLALHLSHSPAFAQKERSGYQLLWKISGNGLRKPSYLFGTMHSRIDKVFDFSDSVLVKLEECEAFAMEVSPDSVLDLLMNGTTPDKMKDTADAIENRLSAEEYKALGKKLRSETGLSLQKLKGVSATTLINLLTYPLPARSDKSTFLDAYLYGLARKADKALLSLEEVRDQTELLAPAKGKGDKLEELKALIYDDTKSGFKTMLDLYWQGDLNKLYSLVTGSASPEYMNRFIDVRNANMARRIAEYAPLAPTFFAVGAAHLPGEKGLIQMLTRKGFTVTPVKATFTGMAKRYKASDKISSWYHFTNEESFYAADMPSKPYLLKSVAAEGVKMYVLPDLGSGLYYYVMGLSSSILSADPDKFIDLFISGLTRKDNTHIRINRKTQYNGYPAREIETVNGTNDFFSSIRMVIRGNNCYMLMVGSQTKEGMHSKDLERFMGSLSISDIRNAGWKTLSSSEGAFEVDAPCGLQRLDKDQVNEHGRIVSRMYTNADPASGINYMVVYTQAQPGRYFPNDSIYLQTALDNVLRVSKGELVHSRDLRLQGFPGKEFEIKAGLYRYKGRSFIRGARYYTAFSVSTEEQLKNPDIETFLASMRFKSVEPATFREYTSTSYGFSIMVPPVLVKETDSSTYFYSGKTSINLNFQDTLTGISYVISVMQHHPYYFTDEKKFYEEMGKNYMDNKDDSLVSEKESLVNGIRVKEITVKSRQLHELKRVKMIPGDSVTYRMIVLETTDNPAIHARTNEFFDSFRFTQVPVLNIFKPKTEKLLLDGSSDDTLVSAPALRWLIQHTFTESDIPLAGSYLQRPVKNDSLGYHSFRGKLLQTLLSIKDARVPGMIQEAYPSFRSQPELEANALAVLLSDTSEKSFSLFQSLVKKYPVRVKVLPYYCFNAFYDSLPLAAKRMSQLLELSAAQPVFIPSLAGFCNRMLDSALIKPEILLPYQKGFIACLRTRLEENKPENNAMEENDFDYRLLDLAELIGHTPADPEFIKLARLIHTKPNLYISFQGLKLLANYRERADPAAVARLAADDNYRHKTYSLLKKSSLQSVFPARYCQQRYMAQSIIMTSLNDLDEYPDSLVMLDSKVVGSGKSQSRYFLFKYHMGDDWHAAICGPCPYDKKDLVIPGNAAYTDFKTYPEELPQQSKLFDELIKASATADKNSLIDGQMHRD